MGNIFNDDFRDFIQQLNYCNVKYILVGGYSVMLHGYPRTTGDMDIWVEKSVDNYKRLSQAFLGFGMPLFDMTEENFLHHPNWEVFTFGRPPASIDIMISVKGMNFAECFEKAVWFEDAALKIKTIHINDLLAAKKASGRHKDQQDIDNLKSKE